MNKKVGKKMIIALIILLIILGVLFIWFMIPYSPLKSTFKKDVIQLIDKNKINDSSETFSYDDFSEFPLAIQKYVEKSGYIGKKKMSFLKMKYNNVDFMQGQNGPKLKIDYIQYNFVKEPDRLALIDSSMFGIPFEGYDRFLDGKGSMKGVIAKLITLFDQKGNEMDKACLVTFLAESFFAPNILLQDYISFEEIDEYNIKATITYNGIEASGVFTFNENYEMISFTTNDRAVVGTDGSIEYIKWSAVCEDYKVADNGIKYPTKFKAIWNYPEKNFVYFDGKILEISYEF